MLININNVLKTRVSTCLSQGTGVWRVWVSVVIAEVFGNIVACQLGHNVGDVAVRAEVLQPLMSTTLWRKTSIVFNTRTTATAPPARKSFIIQVRASMKHLQLINIMYNNLFHVTTTVVIISLLVVSAQDKTSSETNLRK